MPNWIRMLNHWMPGLRGYTLRVSVRFLPSGRRHTYDRGCYAGSEPDAIRLFTDRVLTPGTSGTSDASRQTRAQAIGYALVHHDCRRTTPGSSAERLRGRAPVFVMD